MEQRTLNKGRTASRSGVNRVMMSRPIQSSPRRKLDAAVKMHKSVVHFSTDQHHMSVRLYSFRPLVTTGQSGSGEQAHSKPKSCQ